MNEAAGERNYQIQRAYLDNTAEVAVGVARGQLTVNVGAVSLVMSPWMARRITAEIALARIVHDTRYMEPEAEVVNILTRDEGVRHDTQYICETGLLSCSCKWQATELDAAKADALVMRHLRDEGVIA